MNLSYRSLGRCVGLLMLSLAFSAAGYSSGAQEPAPDNSKTNQRDRDKASPTADDQKMNAQDRELARKIRQAIVSDKTLSTYAHNVKVIAQDGKVTLKGPVRSADEKAAVAGKASSIAGDENVRDQMEVAPPRS